MKLEKAALARFLKAPDVKVAAILIFGPDEGLVHERVGAVRQAVLGAGDDPFRLVEIDAGALEKDPARLLDEVMAVSMMGGRRVVHVSRAGDAQKPIFEALLERHAGSADCLVMVETGNLTGKSSLKRLFEATPHAAAIPCYLDDARDLPALIGEHLRASGLGVAADALSYLASHLGEDRGVTRAELDKLVLYMGERKKIELADALACIGDRAALGQDDLVMAVGEGERQKLDRLLDRALDETEPISLLRAMARHFMRLHQVVGELERGRDLGACLSALRPPIFFKTRPQFERQCRIWSVASIGRALLRLSEIEAEAMRHHEIGETLVRRGMLEIAQMAPRR